MTARSSASNFDNLTMAVQTPFGSKPKLRLRRASTDATCKANKAAPCRPLVAGTTAPPGKPDILKPKRLRVMSSLVVDSNRVLMLLFDMHMCVAVWCHGVAIPWMV